MMHPPQRGVLGLLGLLRRGKKDRKNENLF
jgi:hypothetical protein